MPTNRIDVLDGWRCLSVGLVIGSHLAAQSSLGPNFSESTRSLISNFGQIGVEFFFVISGFVICSGLQREQERFGKISISGFYIRRAFRILPPLCIYLLTIALLALSGVISIKIVDFVRSVLFLCNLPFVSECGWYVAHTWSLAYEEQFYLVFPAVFVMIGIYRRSGFLLISGAIVVALLLLFHIRSPLSGELRHFFSITCGIVCAAWWPRLVLVLKRIPIPVTVALCLVPFATQIASWDYRITWLSYFIFVGPSIALGILSTVVRPEFSFLGSRLLSATGRASYGLYLWQQLVLSPEFDVGLGYYVIGLGLMGAIVAALFVYVETPLIAAGRLLARSSLPPDSSLSGAKPPVV